MPSKKLIAQLNLQRTKIFLFVCCLIVFLTASRTISWGEDEDYAEDVNADGRGRSRPEQVSNNVRQRPMTTKMKGGGHFSGGPRSCDPFRSLGSLQTQLSPFWAAWWVPWDRSCPPSKLFYNLIFADPLKLPSMLDGSIARSTPPPPAVPNVNAAAAPPASPNTILMPDSNVEDYSWIVNRTILLHGDSIERYHLQDFCHFAGGELTLITHNHTLTPPPSPPSPLAKATLEELVAVMDGDVEEAKKLWFWQQRRELLRTSRWETFSTPLTRPWVCRVEKWGLTLVSVFTYGFGNGEKDLDTERMIYGEEGWYYPPLTWDDRLTEITVPLLSNLAKNLSSPHIEFPDLIELSSTLWDARTWSEHDFRDNNVSFPYPENTSVPFADLTKDRTDWWDGKMRENVKKVAKLFPVNLEGKPAKILWRLPHHPLKNYWTPYNRIYVLEQLGRYGVEELRKEARMISQLRRHRNGGGRGRWKDLASSIMSWRNDRNRIRQVLSQQQQDQGGGEEEDLGLDERLDVNEWGPMILGQEHRYLDLVHPAAIPATWFWAEIILFELRKAVTGYPMP